MHGGWRLQGDRCCDHELAVGAEGRRTDGVLVSFEHDGFALSIRARQMCGVRPASFEAEIRRVESRFEETRLTTWRFVDAVSAFELFLVYVTQGVKRTNAT